MLVHDSNGNIFGGFASAVWEVRAQYYGNGECFLFSFAVGGEFHKYKCSGANKFFQLAHDVSSFTRVALT